MLDTYIKNPLDILDFRVSDGMNCIEISAYHGHLELMKELYSRVVKVRTLATWA